VDDLGQPPKICYIPVTKNTHLELTMSVVSAIIGISAKPLVMKINKGSKMENITVGSQFTTQKSGVTGIVQEVIENKTGSFRVRLDVNGEPRWTTVKK
jgi:hypothetical protein